MYFSSTTIKIQEFSELIYIIDYLHPDIEQNGLTRSYEISNKTKLIK